MAQGGRRGLAVLAVAAAACGGDGTSRSGPVVTDSAGISVVQNGAPAWGAGGAWLVDADPLLAVGSLNGPLETQFFNLVDTRIRGDGSVVVAAAGDSRVAAFAPDGSFLWTQGRQGEGPGEYVQLSLATLLTGDSVLAYDVRTRRATVLGPDGAVAREFTPQPPAGGSVSRPEGEVAPGILAASGGAVFGSGGPVSEQVMRAPERFILTDTEGTVADSLTVLPGREMWMLADGNSVSIWTLPFGRTGRLVAGPGMVVSGDTERPEWEVRDASGRLVRIIRLRVQDRTVTNEEWERALELRVPTDGDAAQQASVRSTFARIPKPERWPVFSDLVVDDLRHTWVRQFLPPWAEDDPSRWWVFDPDGVLLGEVTFPAGLEVDQIRGDRAVGRWTDELGVEQVRVYRIVGR